MNASKFKVLLYCYAIGIVGCNKIESPSYMDGGGDRKDDKKQEVEVSFSVEQSSSNVVVLHGSTKGYKEMLEDSINFLQRTASIAEEVASNKQQAADRAEAAAANAEATAKMARKTADDAEKDGTELGGGDSLYSKSLEDSLNLIRGTASVAEEVASNKRQAADRAKAAAANAKATAEMARKTADDAEKDGTELGGGDAS